MEYNRIMKDGTNLFLGQVGNVVIGLINMMILTRVLTTEDMGKYSLFLMVVNLAVQLGLNWSDASVLRHGREEYVKYGKINRSFWARFYLFMPLVILCTVGYLIFYKKITDYIGLPTYVIFFIILNFLMLSTISYMSNVYRSIDDIKRASYITVIQKLFYLVGLGLIYLNILERNIIVAIIAINLSFLLALIVNLIGFDKSKITPYKFEKAYFRKIWSYSWPQLIGFSGLYVINYVDLYVIKTYMTLRDVGIYNVAYNGFTLITGAILLINTLFLPLIVEYKAKKRYDLIIKYFKKIPIFSALWVLMIICGLFLSNFIITFFFSNKYIESIPSFNVLLIATIFYFVYVSLMPFINAFDLILYNQVFNVIKSVINVILDFILVPKIGIIGAAYGTTISFFVGMILTALVVYIKRKTIFKKSKDI